MSNEYLDHANTLGNSRLKKFLTETSGAVTVDWVVLSAAIIAMVVGFMATFTSGVDGYITNGFLVKLMAALI